MGTPGFRALEDRSGGWWWTRPDVQVLPLRESRRTRRLPVGTEPCGHPAEHLVGAGDARRRTTSGAPRGRGAGGGGCQDQAPSDIAAERTRKPAVPSTMSLRSWVFVRPVLFTVGPRARAISFSTGTVNSTPRLCR